MCYPLFLIYGQSGFEINIPLVQSTVTETTEPLTRRRRRCPSSSSSDSNDSSSNSEDNENSGHTEHQHNRNAHEENVRRTSELHQLHRHISGKLFPLSFSNI